MSVGSLELEVFVPGRLCILGEHTDWAAQHRTKNDRIPCGFTLVCATNEGLYAKVTSTNNATLRFEHNALGSVNYRAENMENTSKVMEWPLDIDTLRDYAKQGGFFSYIAGTAAVVLGHPKFAERPNKDAPLTGLLINNYRTTLPMKKGLSSSAAVCVLVATAFDRVYQLGFTQAELMEIAFQGEMLTPSRCGRMDQCVVMGPGAVGLMEFNSTHCTLRKLQLPSTHFPVKNTVEGSEVIQPAQHFVVVDLKSFKDTVVILRELNECFPFPANDTQALMHRYVESIVTIAAKAVAAIESGDAAALAAQMNAAQEEFDACCMPNCPSQLTAPVLHSLLHDTRLREMSLAVKGVGSQGDGSAQILCATPALQQQVLEYIRAAHKMDGFYLTIS